MLFSVKFLAVIILAISLYKAVILCSSVPKLSSSRWDVLFARCESSYFSNLAAWLKGAAHKVVLTYVRLQGYCPSRNNLGSAYCGPVWFNPSDFTLTFSFCFFFVSCVLFAFLLFLILFSCFLSLFLKHNKSTPDISQSALRRTKL